MLQWVDTCTKLSKFHSSVIWLISNVIFIICLCIIGQSSSVKTHDVRHRPYMWKIYDGQFFLGGIHHFWQSLN